MYDLGVEQSVIDDGIELTSGTVVSMPAFDLCSKIFEYSPVHIHKLAITSLTIRNEVKIYS